MSSLLFFCSAVQFWKVSLFPEQRWNCRQLFGVCDPNYPQHWQLKLRSKLLTHTHSSPSFPSYSLPALLHLGLIILIFQLVSLIFSTPAPFAVLAAFLCACVACACAWVCGCAIYVCVCASLMDVFNDVKLAMLPLEVRPGKSNKAYPKVVAFHGFC